MNLKDALKQHVKQLASPYQALSLDEYAGVRMEYELAIQAAMYEYVLDIGGRSTQYKNAFKRAITEYFYLAFQMGYQDGSGLIFPQDANDSDLAWLGAKQTGEYGYVDALFLKLKDLKDESQDVWASEISRRTEGYVRTLDGVYNEGKMRGQLDKALTFTGSDGMESCRTCMKWKGKRHRASFWVKRSLVPGQPGNDAFECHGYNCQHVLIDDNGNLFMLSQAMSNKMPHWHSAPYHLSMQAWADENLAKFDLRYDRRVGVLAARYNDRSK